MARRLPTKMWCVMGVSPTPFESPLFGRFDTTREELVGYMGNMAHRIGRVTIVWEKPAKKKVRR